MDSCGRLWTLVESKAALVGLRGRLWTATGSLGDLRTRRLGDRVPPGVSAPSALEMNLVMHPGLARRATMNTARRHAGADALPVRSLGSIVWFYFTSSISPTCQLLSKNASSEL